MSLPAEAPAAIAVVVIDDNDAIHAGVQAWFAQASPPVRLVASYTAAEPFLDEYPCATGDVDVVLLDLELKSRQPDFAAIECVTAAGHRTLVYSHITHDEVIMRCLDLGAAAYISKTEGRSASWPWLGSGWRDYRDSARGPRPTAGRWGSDGPCRPCRGRG